MTRLLEVKDLWVEGRSPEGRHLPILKGISFTVNRGEVLALIGASGSGKTTALLATMGYAKPGCRISGGNVILDGTDVLTLDTEGRRRLRGRTISYVAQSAEDAFNPALSIGEQVTESSRIDGNMPPAEAERRAVALYRRLDLPEPETLGRRYPHHVSSGQLQRLMAAMALACGPKLLVLDEPTTGLDVIAQIDVLSAFKDIIERQDTAAIYVTHDLAVVAQIADRVAVMYDGEIVEHGSTDEILLRPRHDYTKMLIAAVRPPPQTAVADAGGSNLPALAEQRPVLEVKKLSAGYGGIFKKVVLRDVNASVRRGQVVGVIGESGCGKSTLARVIAGLLPQASGEVLHNSRPLPPIAKRRDKTDLQCIQLVSQVPDTALNPTHRLRDILERPLVVFLGMSPPARKQRIAELLEMVELPAEFESRYPGELSAGEKQRVNLARALAAEPEVLLCDEVISSLDTVVGMAILKLLKHLQQRLGMAYLFISHDLSTVASFADRIVVLHAGQVVEQGPTRDVLAPPHHPYTRLLLSSVPELRRGWLEDVMTTREVRSGINRGVEITNVGCPFFTRCPLAIDGLCDKERPPVRGHVHGTKISCHREIEELRAGFLSH